MILTTAPAKMASGLPRLFLAGGINRGAPWQEDAVTLLRDVEAEVLNPRRPGVLAREHAEEQTRWEHAALRASDVVMFWFPCETLCSITLYELGVLGERGVPLAVGAHPRYARRLDVRVQLSLARPEVQLRARLSTVVDDARALLEALSGREDQLKDAVA